MKKDIKSIFTILLAFAFMIPLNVFADEADVYTLHLHSEVLEE